MTPIGRLVGSGRILADGTGLGAVEHRISAFRPRRLIEARGSIGGDGGLLFEASEASEVELTLETGGQIKIMVTNYPVFSDAADVLVSGDMPGY